MMGGYNPSISYSGVVEQYNGSAWTEIADLNTGRTFGAPANQAPATTQMLAGGETSPSQGGPALAVVEQYNGSAWTEVADLNSAVWGAGGAGVQTAMIAVGGYVPSYNTYTQSWNGSAWTELNDVNAGRYGAATGGTSVSARYVGGAPPGTQGTKNEGWDGTSWTETTESNTNTAGRAGFGSNADDFLAGRGNSSANTEYWNGTSWTELNNQSSATQAINTGGSAGTLDGMDFENNDNSPTSEEWAVAVANSTITVS